jgi:hypothetical protein
MLKLILIAGIYINPAQVTSLIPQHFGSCFVQLRGGATSVDLTCAEVAAKLTEVKVKQDVSI